MNDALDTAGPGADKPDTDEPSPGSFDTDPSSLDERALDGCLPLATDVPGVWLFPDGFERIVAGLRAGIAALGNDRDYRGLAIPPVISRHLIERAGYVKAFPHLLGTVHSFAGNARSWSGLSQLIEAGGAWHGQQQISDLVLLPAACYPAYDTLTGRSLREPVFFSVAGTCFRQEATSERGRFRSFRMAEFVTAGGAEHCLDWRTGWLDRTGDWLTSLALDVEVEVADDPFFGPGRTLFKAAQLAQKLKFELKVTLDTGLVQAVASANYHKDHFGEAFDFGCDGEPGHTACMAFGLERIALALIHAHGPRPAGWPPAVRAALGR